MLNDYDWSSLTQKLVTMPSHFKWSQPPADITQSYNYTASQHTLDSFTPLVVVLPPQCHNNGSFPQEMTTSHDHISDAITPPLTLCLCVQARAWGAGVYEGFPPANKNHFYL